MSAADRQRRYRARVRQGVEVLHIPVQTVSIIEALLETDRLTEEEAVNKQKVEAAVAEIVAEWARQRGA